MTKPKPWYRKPSVLTLVISALTFVSTGIYFVVGFFHSLSMSEVDYMKSAQESQPLLCVAGPPNFDNVGVRISDFNTFRVLKKIKAHKEFDTSDFKQALIMQAHLKITNRSKYLAHCRLYGFIDTVDMTPVMRHLLLTTYTPTDTSQAIPRTITIAAGDTFAFDFKYTAQRLRPGKEFVLHFLIQYTNPAGALFDYYYWAAYWHHEIPYGIGVVVDSAKGRMTSFLNYPQGVSVDSILTLHDQNHDWYIYTRDEAKKMDAYFERLKSDYDKRHAAS